MHLRDSRSGDSRCGATASWYPGRAAIAEPSELRKQRQQPPHGHHRIGAGGCFRRPG